MTRKVMPGFCLVGLVIAAGVSLPSRGTALAARGADKPAPTFEVDPAWPKLPNNWVLGEVTAVAAESADVSDVPVAGLIYEAATDCAIS